jgi:hypothetical protein
MDPVTDIGIIFIITILVIKGIYSLSKRIKKSKCMTKFNINYSSDSE